MNLLPKRETLSLPEEELGLIPTWDYLTIYDIRDNSISARSNKCNVEQTIRLEYSGLS